MIFTISDDPLRENHFQVENQVSEFEVSISHAIEQFKTFSH